MKHSIFYVTIIMTPEKIFENIWEEFMARLRKMRNQTPKVTYEQLGKLCGVSKATTKRWFEGVGGEKTPFPDMLRYMEAVGMDITPFATTGQSSKKPSLDSSLLHELAENKKRIKELERERDDYKSKWEGHLETLEVTARAKEKARLQETELEKFHNHQPDLYSEVSKP